MAEDRQRIVKIDQFIKKWQADLEQKQATWIALAHAALVTRGTATSKQARAAFEDYMRHLAAEDLDPPEGWNLIR